MTRVRWLGALAAAMTAAGCNYDCAYDVLSRAPSPDGLQDVVTYVSSCGAMMSSRWGVALVPHDESLIADNQTRILHYADSTRGPGTLQPATATWRPDGALAVTYDPRADVITQLAVVRRISIVYQVD